MLVDLTGLWKCGTDIKGIYLIQQNKDEVSIHGIGVSSDKYDNIGFGKIEDGYINGIWKDTPYSVNPENCISHQFRIKIENEKTLRGVDSNTFGYGDFNRIYDVNKLKQL